MINDSWRTILQLVKFGWIGVFVTCFGFIAYYILLEIYNFPLYPVYIMVYAIAVVLSFVLNKKFTFKNKSDNIFIKYVIVYMTSLLIGLFLLKLIHFFLLINNFLSILVIVPPRILFTFFFSKFYVFKD